MLEVTERGSNFSECSTVTAELASEGEDLSGSRDVLGRTVSGAATGGGRGQRGCAKKGIMGPAHRVACVLLSGLSVTLALLGCVLFGWYAASSSAHHSSRTPALTTVVTTCGTSSVQCPWEKPVRVNDEDVCRVGSGTKGGGFVVAREEVDDGANSPPVCGMELCCASAAAKKDPKTPVPVPPLHGAADSSPPSAEGEDTGILFLPRDTASGLGGGDVVPMPPLGLTEGATIFASPTPTPRYLSQGSSSAESESSSPGEGCATSTVATSGGDSTGGAPRALPTAVHRATEGTPSTIPDLESFVQQLAAVAKAQPPASSLAGGGPLSDAGEDSVEAPSGGAPPPGSTAPPSETSSVDPPHSDPAVPEFDFPAFCAQYPAFNFEVFRDRWFGAHKSFPKEEIWDAAERIRMFHSMQEEDDEEAEPDEPTRTRPWEIRLGIPEFVEAYATHIEATRARAVLDRGKDLWNAFLTFAERVHVGQRVRLQKLKSAAAAELNGKEGKIVRWDNASDPGRWHVQLDGGEMKSLRAGNLVVLVGAGSAGTMPSSGSAGRTAIQTAAQTLPMPSGVTFDVGQRVRIHNWSDSNGVVLDGSVGVIHKWLAPAAGAAGGRWEVHLDNGDGAYHVPSDNLVAVAIASSASQTSKSPPRPAAQTKAQAPAEQPTALPTAVHRATEGTPSSIPSSTLVPPVSTAHNIERGSILPPMTDFESHVQQLAAVLAKAQAQAQAPVKQLRPQPSDAQPRDGGRPESFGPKPPVSERPSLHDANAGGGPFSDAGADHGEDPVEALVQSGEIVIIYGHSDDTWNGSRVEGLKWDASQTLYDCQARRRNGGTTESVRVPRGNLLYPRTWVSLDLPNSKFHDAVVEVYGYLAPLDEKNKRGWYVWHKNKKLGPVQPKNMRPII